MEEKHDDRRNTSIFSPGEELISSLIARGVKGDVLNLRM
jgi:hypothetical protein